MVAMVPADVKIRPPADGALRLGEGRWQLTRQGIRDAIGLQKTPIVDGGAKPVGQLSSHLFLQMWLIIGNPQDSH
jgi:hypothetical protein